ncbi:M23 family metallopeptidase [Thioclava sp. 15-R06ZXC-3]|uniref:M23 family metallopeptidase n=1 Tax=Thioclava arctica TaxID=3238301 RepID=A0ABV3TLM6_9RHOB
MTAMILAVQVALPLAMLAWLAFLPAGSLAGFALQATGIGAFLFALAKVAQWAVPVWWLPWVYSGLWLGLILVWPLRKNLRNLALLPAGLSGWMFVVPSVVLLSVGGWYGARALAGRSLPSVEVVLAHMRHGQVNVVPGDVLAQGDRLGEVGNSGASTEPHLHIHAQRPAPEGTAPISGEPLALRFNGRFLVRNDRLTGLGW